MRVMKAVIPAAGLGTRFLPATKSIPKEMLPVVDKPAIQYVVEEASAAGLDDVLIIMGRNKNAISNHFDRMAELEGVLEEKGDDSKLESVQEPSGLADVHYVRQGDPKGLGHAVLQAKRHVAGQPFALLLGDDLIDADDDLLQRMMTEFERLSSSVIALMEVDTSEIERYGVAAVEPTEVEGVVKVVDLVEKPAAAEAPSNLAVIGRYVLHPAVFDVLERTEPGKGGEIQLTDALQYMAQNPGETGGVYGVVFRGKRYDTGDKVDYIKAVVQLALQRDDLAPQLTEWLKTYVKTI